MFEKEAKRSFDELDDRGIGDDWSIEEAYENGFSNGGIFGYNILKEELEQEKCELLGLIQGKDKVIKELEEEYAYQLIKAKKIIGNLYAICKDNHYPNSSILMEEAEQFLKENKYDR